jgi:hypothetical protein
MQHYLDMGQVEPSYSAQGVAFEKHFTVDEVSELWGVSRATVVKMFTGIDGVLTFGREESRFKRQYISMRIPESLVKAVHQKLGMKKKPGSVK